MAESASYLFEDVAEFDPKAAKKHLRPVIRDALELFRNRLVDISEWNAAEIHAALEAVAEETGLNFGKIGQPVRVAVTGGSVSPPIDVTLELIGKQRSIQRMDHALKFINQRAAASR